MIKTVILTGASGFVGQNIAKFLIKAKIKVIAVGGTKAISLDKVTWFYLNNTNIKNIAKICYKKYEDIAVVHAGGLIYGTKSALNNANIEFTKELRDAFLEVNPQIPIIFLSSVSAINKIDHYGFTKYQAEQALLHSMLKNVLILRPTLIYGKNDKSNIASLIDKINNKKIIYLPGGNNIKLQPLYIDDLSRIIVKYLQNPETKHKIYILAGPKPIKLSAMVGILAFYLNRKIKIVNIPLRVSKIVTRIIKLFTPKYNPQWLRFSENSFDTSWAKQDFNFNPIEFKDGAALLISSLTANKSK